MARWNSQYLLDPSSSIQKGWNEIVVSKIETTLQEDEWLYESQLADRLKDSALTKILIDAKDFDDRLSEHPSAAAAGYKQYNYTRYLRRHETQLKDTAGCRTENDLKPDEYTAAASHMRDNYGQPASKKQRTTTKKEKEPESAESIALRQAKSNLASSCRKAKGMCDRMRAECEEWKSKSKTVTAQGYPQAMEDHLVAKVDAVMKLVDYVHGLYVDVVSKPAGSPIATVEKHTTDVDMSMNNLENAHSAFKKTTAIDIKRMSSCADAG